MSSIITWDSDPITIYSSNSSGNPMMYRRKQIDALLNHCSLIEQAISHLQNQPKSPGSVNATVNRMKEACDSAKSVAQLLTEKGFLWCLMHSNQIDEGIRNSENKMAQVYTTSGAFADSNVTDFRNQMAREREADNAYLTQYLRTISEADSDFITLLLSQNGMRFQELVVAILKYVQRLPSLSQFSPEDVLLQVIAKSISCIIGKSIEEYQVSPCVLSSLEVEFNLLSPVGNGSSGQVYKGEWNGAVVAVKRMHAEDARTISEEQRKAMRHEVKVWSSLQHPNILTFYGACLEAAVPFIVMRYCPFGNISQYLEKHSNADRTRLSYEVTLGLAFLHGKNIVHADVKAANVLVGTDHHALLTDFGLSLKLQEIRSQSTFSRDIDRQRGTLLWMAPEVLLGASPDMSADVYSLGITIWEIFSGQTPFQGVINDQILMDNVVSRNMRPKRPSRLSQDRLWAVVQRCWVAERESRPKAKEVQSVLQPLMQDIDKDVNTLAVTMSSMATQTPVPPESLNHGLSPEKAITSSTQYDICNRTGLPIYIWPDIGSGTTAKESTKMKIANGETTQWGFGSTLFMPQRYSYPDQKAIGIEFIDTSLDQIRCIRIDEEGECKYAIRSTTAGQTDYLLREVEKHDGIKHVTLRSLHRIENKMALPLEIAVPDDNGANILFETIPPGRDYALPVSGSGRNRIKLKPDQRLGYLWSPFIWREDLLAQQAMTVRCHHASGQQDDAFWFQVWMSVDKSQAVHPQTTLKVCAPMEVENLLPFDIVFCIWDQFANTSWRNFARKRQIASSHTVDPDHTLLLNIDIQNSAFLPSEFAIINVSPSSRDFKTEDTIKLFDHHGKMLRLKLNYIRYPEAGGAFVVQIYSSYLVVNKTGLPMTIEAWSGWFSNPSPLIVGDSSSESTSKPGPFMLPADERSTYFRFKLQNYVWSQFIDFKDPLGSAHILLSHTNMTFTPARAAVEISWCEGPGKYKLTKVITLLPQIMLRNNYDKALSFWEYKSSSALERTVGPGEDGPMYFTQPMDKLITIGLAGNVGWSRSDPMNLNERCVVQFRLNNASGKRTCLLMLSTVGAGFTIYVVVAPVGSVVPARIEALSPWDDKLPA
ncbi:hypothetical protein NM688_g5467 [Phlebia brevispora]|uniref:Uncharacterized protein n=1 Tax=Phlebia brevispora TaxID=194682 RepID=A0ACC1SUT7_9APHY|nr:hypothetical protein NM688_g5467 [Phlebia brevispora]